MSAAPSAIGAGLAGAAAVPCRKWPLCSQSLSPPPHLPLAAPELYRRRLARPTATLAFLLGLLAPRQPGPKAAVSLSYVALDGPGGGGGSRIIVGE